MSRLFPICRSLTGNGVRRTLAVLAEYVPIVNHEISSGTQVFDWQIPLEWNIRDAYVADGSGRRVIDFRQNNLHVLGYSIPFEGTVSLSELREHLFSLPAQPDAIPYLTSYYAPRWGFCLSHKQLESLKDGTYRVCIDTTLAPGALTYGELILPGETSREVLLSTYLCHPSLANDNLSGVVVMLFLAKMLFEKTRRRYTYRILFVPETIGSIAYLSQHKDVMIERTVAGFVATCVGDGGAFQYLRSRREGTLADRVAEHVLAHSGCAFSVFDYTHRASDERQYCSPGIDLPVGSLMRSRYNTFPEYHTSLDNLDLVNPDALAESLRMYEDCIDVIEANRTYRVTIEGGEPSLGRRGLYPTLGAAKDTTAKYQDLLGLLAYCDGKHDLIAIADKHHKPVQAYYPHVKALLDHRLIEPVD